MIVNRDQALAFLKRLLTRHKPGAAQLVLLYGRRRVGKSTFLLHWAAQGKTPFTLDIIGSHWNKHVQVDVVAVNWQTRQI